MKFLQYDTNNTNAIIQKFVKTKYIACVVCTLETCILSEALPEV